MLRENLSTNYNAGVVRETNADHRNFIAILSTRKLTPFVQRYCAVKPEVLPVVEAARLVEMVQERCVNRNEFL